MFAVFRAHPTGDLAKIGEAHLKQDLESKDRDLLKSAARKVSTHATVGSLIGMGLGLAMAWRIRANRIALYNAFQTALRPTEVIFANGRREAVPDLDPFIRPTGWGDAATFGAFSLGGLFLGGETGFLTGTASATRTISKDPDSRIRIENAFRKFQVDVLKREINSLEKATASTSTTGSGGGGDSGYSSDKRGSWDRLKEQAAGLASNLRR
ncbi:hypothetical protein B0H63DRAFT_219651 [Podospora didyma]|uniref:Uncharacterized protein n=1 Tax=Podospora didyma TaxID=330526 RepID=A0AAE0KJN7_9PEZI|nr:hypothetical protein B0H63DRAFT_219651 [Podospora didyma]